MVPFLMRGRNESAVYFEQTIDLSRTLPWLEEFNRDRSPERKITIFPLLLYSAAHVLHERPRLNRFVSGRRIHERDGVWISFAAKKRMDDEAPLSLVKRRFPADERFADMVADLQGDMARAKSDERSAVDKELGVLLRLPTPVLDGAVRLLRALDFLNLAPRALLETDPMYTSVFVANLGSIKIDAAYHHLYEHGNCPLFVTVGRVEKTPMVAEDGTIEARDAVKLKYTYDERVEDGMYCARALELFKQRVESPDSWIS